MKLHNKKSTESEPFACRLARCLANTARLAIGLLSLQLFAQPATGPGDLAEWIVAEKLASRIQNPTPALSLIERRRFITMFTEFIGDHNRWRVEEQDLRSRVSADQNELKEHLKLLTDYEKQRAAWQEKLAQHNASCDRTFADPAEVARCDASGDALAKERNALDAQESKLAERKVDLEARQVETTSLVNKHETGYAAWAMELDVKFNRPLQEALTRKVGTTTLRLTVKSFIKVIDLSSLSADSRPRAERAFAWITNRNFSETPETPAPNSMDFRLWSQAVVRVTCRGDMVASWRTSRLAHRGGTELRILDAETSVLEPLKVMPAAQGTEEPKSLELSYGIKGKPHDFAIPTFRAVRPRTCESIWHRVQATVICRDGEAQMDVNLSGSKFPSHRSWVNNVATTTIEQGPFSDLWECDASAPNIVR